MIEVTFKGHRPTWDSDLRSFEIVERSRVKVVRTVRPALWRYYRFVGVVVEDAGDLLEVQTYGGTTLNDQTELVFERKPARLMPRWTTRWQFN